MNNQNAAAPTLSPSNNMLTVDPYADNTYTALTSNHNSANNSISLVKPLKQTGQLTASGFNQMESPFSGNQMHTSLKYNQSLSNRKAITKGSSKKSDGLSLVTQGLNFKGAS